MKINGKEYLNPQQQLVENTKDIEELKNIIKPEYKTTATLTSSSTSVAIATTNAPDGTTEGWLLTEDGLKFKITGGDETNLLLVFYADLKGPQGESGAAVNIDDTGTAVDKCWSSNKTNSQINTEVAKAKDKGIYWTSTLPTPNDGTYTYNKLDLSNINTNIPFKTGDLIVYVDMTDSDNPVVSKMLQMDDVSDPDYVTASALGDIGGGKQLYQHNVELKIETSSSVYAEIVLQIINDSNVAFTKDSLATYATYSADRPINNIIANGFWFDKTNTKQYRVNKLYNYNGLQWNCTDCNVTVVSGSGISPIYANFTYTISDSIIPL